MVKVVNVDEAARILGVSRRTIYYWIQQGRLQVARNAWGQRVILPEDHSAFMITSRRLRGK